MIDYKEIGKNLKDLRIKMNMTQEEMADYIGITQPEISNLENGKSGSGIDNLSKLDYIGECCDSNLKELLFGSRETKDNNIAEYILHNIIVYSPAMKAISQGTDFKDIPNTLPIKTFLPFNQWDSCDVVMIRQAINSEDCFVKQMGIYCIYFSIINFYEENYPNEQNLNREFSYDLINNICRRMQEFTNNETAYKKWAMMILYTSISETFGSTSASVL